MTNDGARQATVRAATGTTHTYEGDWHALFDQAGIAAGTFNGRMLAWINAQLSAAYTDLMCAMDAFATSQGAPNWSSLGSFTIGGGPKVITTEAGVDITTESGSNITLEQ